MTDVPGVAMVKNGEMIKQVVLQLFICSVLCIVICQTGCADPGNNDIMYQTNAFGLLENGSMHKVITVKEMNTLGNMGAGGFEGLNGELIQVDGTVYQVTIDGKVSIPDDNTGVTFMNTVQFNPKWSVSVPGQQNFTELEDEIIRSFPSKNLVYAIRVDGTFSEIKARSIPGQNEPYPPLAAVIANQSVFNFSNTTGTISGFWFPKWMQGTNYAGFHLHYLSEDRTGAGHLLGCEIENGTIFVDPITTFQVQIE